METEIKDLFTIAKTEYLSKGNCLIFNAILWVARSSVPWRDFTEHFGSWKTVYSHFCKQHDEEVLNSIFHHLNEDADYKNLSMIL